jgi:adenylyltransferase/sulfurtransferase
VLGVLPGIIGTIQATEAIKLILGAGDTLIGRLLLFDALRMTFRTLKLQRDPECPVCGDHPTVKALIDYEMFCGITPPQQVAASGDDGFETVEELKARLDRKIPSGFSTSARRTNTTSAAFQARRSSAW